jgi:hypothetical protein
VDIANGNGDRFCIGFTFFANDKKWKLPCPYGTTLSKENAPTKSDGTFHGFCKGCSTLQNNVRGNLLVSVHRVFWNMQWDMLGLASTAMLWATLWLIEGVILTVFLEIGEASGHSK